MVGLAKRIVWAQMFVWVLWGVMTLGAFWTSWLARGQTSSTGFLRLGMLANAAVPAAGAAAFMVAVRRIRGRTRIADGFFPLVLLNPLLFAHSTGPFDRTLLGAGLLGLMAGTIIAMRRNSYMRYLGVALLAMALTLVSDSFVLLLPTIIAWLVYAAVLLARSKDASERTRGYAVMAAAEIALITFGMACIFAEPTAAPQRAALFLRVVSFAEFPLLVIAIIMLALGWRRSPDSGGRAAKTPPYFWGMLALLIGLLVMLLDSFQAGAVPAPGADQTAVILCLLYTVSALHGPRRLHYLLPPMLLVAAVVVTLMR
jgi:hypothetical protein